MKYTPAFLFCAFAALLTATPQLPAHTFLNTPGVSSGANYHGNTDTTGSEYLTPEMPLYIGRLNNDCIPDTVYGAMDKQFNYRPLRIAWGYAASLSVRYACRQDSSERNDTALDHRRVRTTRFYYPNWSGMTCSVSFVNLDTDAVTDIIVFIRGKVSADTSGGMTRKGGGGNSIQTNGTHNAQSVMTDTTIGYVLFGQAELETVSAVHFDRISETQDTGFTARQLRPGIGLSEGKIRDLSGRMSYLLLPATRPQLQHRESKTTPVLPNNTPLINENYPPSSERIQTGSIPGSDVQHARQQRRRQRR